MNISITDKAKEKLSLMQEKNMPIMLAKYPVGWSGFIYKIVSVKQSENDNLYNVDGINILIPRDLEKSLKGAKINFGGLLFKDFIVTPQF